MDDILKDNITGTNNGELYANTPLKYLTASSIIGDRVLNLEEEDLGFIKDIMLDINTGKIEYFVLEYGGVLGVFSKYFAIPFAFMKVDPKRKLFVLNQPKDKLKDAPGFNTYHWPDTNIHLEKVNHYWSFMG